MNQQNKIDTARNYFGKYLLSFSFLLFLSNCSYDMLPKEKLDPYQTSEKIKITNEVCTIKLSNPLECPLRFWIQNENKEISKIFHKTNPITLEKKSDSTLVFPKITALQIAKMNYPSRYGNPKMKIYEKKITLPFKKNSSYKITQGNNGSFSHQTDYSRYAIDFNLNTGDTICAVADGFVVGVIDGYSKGGKNKKWRDYANLITIYHPVLNLFSQYVHLKKEGSLVKVGEKVAEHQPIGLCGITGYTSGDHLHFALLKAVDSTEGLASIPIEFKEGYKGIELKKNDLVKKNK